MNFKVFWSIFKEAGTEWVNDKCPRLGAALAFYTAFAIAPLLLIAISIAGLVFGQQAAQGQIVDQLEGLIGEEGGRALESMIANAYHPQASIVATIIGIVVLLVGALGLFVELQDALNTMWGIQPKPGRSAVWTFVRDRLLSFAMVMGVAFLLMASLIVSAVLAAIGDLFGAWQFSWFGEIINFVISFAVLTVGFAMIYRFLPDIRIAWSDVWLGAAITTLLFMVGKFLIGLYLGHSSIGSAYGAAGSFAVLLTWLYYSAQIFLFGAELTKAYANHLGSKVTPSEHGIVMTEEARARQGLSRKQFPILSSEDGT